MTLSEPVAVCVEPVESESPLAAGASSAAQEAGGRVKRHDVIRRNRTTY